MAQQRKTFTPTKLNLSEISDESARVALESKFSDYRVQRQLAVETIRKSLVASLEAKIQEAQAQITLNKFLLEASEHFDEVAQEPVWFAYKQNGEIVLESPFTERDMRNGIRLQRAQMEHTVNSLQEDGRTNTDLYESEGDDE